MNETNVVFTSEVNELFAALSKFQGQVENIDLDMDVSVNMKDGNKYGFRYASLAAILNAIRKPLSENGLGIVQVPSWHSMVTIITHSSGQHMIGTTNFQLTAVDAQRFGSLITYMRRYSLLAVLGLSRADDDDDGNSAVGNDFDKKASTEHPSVQEQREKRKKMNETKDTWGNDSITPNQIGKLMFLGTNRYKLPKTALDKAVHALTKGQASDLIGDPEKLPDYVTSYLAENADNVLSDTLRDKGVVAEEKDELNILFN